MAQGIDWIKYLGLGAGATIVTALAGNISQIQGFLSTLDGFGFMGITAKGVALAALGVLAADQLFFRK